MSDCHDHCCKIHNSNVSQTLDELDFERGLWFAAQYGDLERVEKLLSSGSCTNQPDTAGYTALHYAARNGHAVVSQRLIAAGASVNAVTRAGQATALHRAASAGKEEIVHILLKSGANAEIVDADGKTALHRATEQGHIDIVKALLKHNHQLKYIKDGKGNIPLNYAENMPSLRELLTSCSDLS